MSDSTFEDAIDAGDGALHGAIDYWQKKHAESEARLAEAWAWAEKVKEALEVYIETGFDDALYTAIEQCPEQEGGSHD